MKQILITGANGLLGQKLVYKMKGMHQVHCIATSKGINRLLSQEGYEYYAADVIDYDRINEVIRESKPDYIINTAAMTNVDACEEDKETCKRINTDAVKNLANICDELNIHLIHLSTDFIFDGKEGPYDENAVPNPLSYYGLCKWEAEKIVQQMQAPWTIIRTVLVYGIVDNMSRSNIVLWVKKSLEEGKNINLVNDQWRTPTLAEDLAEGCLLVALKNATGFYNISGKDFMSIFDMACKVAEHYGLDKKFIHATDSESLGQPAKRPPRTGFIIDKAVKELGYEPMSFEESLTIIDKQIMG